MSSILFIEQMVWSLLLVKVHDATREEEDQERVEEPKTNPQFESSITKLSSEQLGNKSSGSLIIAILIQ